MRYKRESPFRYEFEEPIPVYFSIAKIEDESVTTSEGLAQLVDISPSGVKLRSELNIPDAEHKTIELSLRFQLNENEFNCNGIIKWKKELVSELDYGIQLLVDEHAEEEIINELKIYAKNSLD